jgi:hypothetical protein
MKPPKRVRYNAELALEERELWRGVKNMPTTRVGLARANQLVRGDDITIPIMKRMYSYFQRHQHDNLGWDRDSKGRLGKGMISWLAWGGDEGWDWVERELSKALKETGGDE